ncbi:sigma factor [Micromonospora zamorensis]|uniref:sigma factor n=1 Tax=Micromonospora zamorensis TaxID=709883 RepID=UPI0037B43D58
MTFEEYAFARTSALIRLARLLTDDEHRAEDLVQEVLARAYARWGRISRTDRPDAYVRRMLVTRTTRGGVGAAAGRSRSLP